MKRFLSFCLIFALALTAVSAQADTDRRGKRGGDPAEREAKMLERLTEALELTDAQVVQIQTFQAENREARKAEMENAENREERAAIFKQYAARADEKMKTILDAGQFEKYASIKAKMQERRKQGRNDRGNHRVSDGLK